MDDVIFLLKKKRLLNRTLLPQPREEERYRVHLNCILSNLVYSYQYKRTGGLYYSRSITNNVYIVHRKYNPLRLNKDMLIRIVDALLNSEMIKHKSHDRFENLSSRMTASSILIRLFTKYSFSSDYVSWSSEFDALQINEMRTTINQYGKSVKSPYLIDFEDTDETIEIRNSILEYSDMLRNHTFDCCWLPQSDFYNVKRVFRDDLDKGGRYYTPWQSKLKKPDRRNILIDGKPTCEIDYRGNHIKILYAILCGIDYQLDPYDMAPYQDATGRELLKVLLLTLINSSSDTSCVKSMNDKKNGKRRQIIAPDGAKAETKMLDEDSYNKFNNYCINREINFKDLIAEFKIKHHPISGAFGTDKANALYLQRIDSEICSKIIERFVVLDKPILTLHDSFIVIKEDGELLKETMVYNHQYVLGLKDVNVYRLLKEEC